MKNIRTSIIVFTLFALAILGCNKDITQADAGWMALNPAKLDTAAGNWKTSIINSGTDNYNIPVPTAVTSAAYQQEIADLKTVAANLTDAQRTAITYWSVGGVLRWNEIMRALVTKYNLPIQESADGTYAIPDQTNPFAYPQFPFSNPPYAARAYAYVSVAQYEALVAAYKLKMQYRRPAPYKTDASIKPLVPVNDLPSYPSEDAVIASVSLEIMKFLFPTEVDFLNQKAAEHKQYKLWAGAAVNSDIAAGDSLGKVIATKILARAKTDGMKNAVGNAGKWDSLAKRTLIRMAENGKDTISGDAGWISQDAPIRPPMLPFFGNVKAWFFTNPASVRMPPPPATNSALVKTQIDELLGYSKNPTRENLAIVHFWADGAGSQTPPGHWNAIAADLIQSAQMSEVRTARNFALLNMSMMDAGITCWDNKYTYYHPRPCQLNPEIKTMTGLPNFPGYTSGHSTFSGAASTYLAYLFPSQADKLTAQAKEASLSRILGCIHLRVDCEIGLLSGNKIGQLAIDRAKTDGAD